MATIAASILIMSCGGSRAPSSSTGAIPPARAPRLPEPGTYDLDPPHTFAYFNAQHVVVGMVRGRFDKISGKITVSKDLSACGVDVSIEAASVSTQNATRDEDLRSPAFFDATASPTIEYHGHGIHQVGEKWLLDGALTIRGNTKPVPLEVRFNGVAPAKGATPKRVAFHAAATAKRADFGMTRDLLDEIGTTSDRPDVWIEIDAEALQSASAAQ